MADLRMYCSEKFKRAMKATAAEQGMSISELLTSAVRQSYPQIMEENSDYGEELKSISQLLATSGGKMTVEQRQKLKCRKKKLQHLIEEGGRKNGRN